ncbi:hypothetical protein [Olleya aquimaris]|uniref:Uncharacterized protein n=1 Tax=Olleya aquimaris TaxID=639310 RepID=A0A327RR61_9FLAO|nr:hypothetical protein [Olleya aquimaris]RAJ18154.1 hypothetical protein LY08_00428 [Olleya aquimaris]
MLHLFWSFINTVIVLYFLFLLVQFIRKGKKMFQSQFRLVSIFILVFGIVQILAASKSDDNVNKIIISDNYSKNNTSEVKKMILEDNLTFEINLLVKYSVDQHKFIPTESYSNLTGFVSGYEWEFLSIEINTAEEHEVFEVSGILKWNLFGINIYNQNKQFKKTVNLIHL